MTALMWQLFMDTPRPRIEIAAKTLLVISLFVMPISTAATNVFMALTLIAWLVAGRYRARWTALRNNSFAWATAGLILMTCVGSLWSTGSQEDILYYLHKYAKLLFMLPAITLMQEEKWRERGLMAFSAAMMLTLALSLMSVVRPLAFIGIAPEEESNNHYVFRDYIAQNLMMSFFAIMLAVKCQFDSARHKRIAYGLLALLSTIDILFFVQGRTGYVSLALNAIVFVVFLNGWQRRLVATGLVGFLVLLTMTYSATFKTRVDAAVKEYETQDENKLTSVGQRLEFAKKGFQLMTERPLLGFGTGALRKEFCRVANIKEWCLAGNFHPHNQFVAFGVQLGAVGILGYLSFLIVYIMRALSLAPTQKIMGIGLAATLIADSFFHAPLFLISEAAFFMLLLPIFMAVNEQDPKRI